LQGKIEERRAETEFLHGRPVMARGTVVIAGDWEAPGMRFVRAFLSVLWREAGF
jgi:hypothetical protein